MFFVLETIYIYISSYADDTTTYTTASCIEDVIGILEKISNKIFHWIALNPMKADEDNFNLLISKSNTVSMKINGVGVISSEFENLLGIKIDHELNFEHHLNGLCKKASSKLHTLARISHFLNVYKERVLMNSFFYALVLLSGRSLITEP